VPGFRYSGDHPTTSSLKAPSEARSARSANPDFR
jgi:hypothetical protein